MGDSKSNCFSLLHLAKRHQTVRYSGVYTMPFSDEACQRIVFISYRIHIKTVLAQCRRKAKTVQFRTVFMSYWNSVNGVLDHSRVWRTVVQFKHDMHDEVHLGMVWLAMEKIGSEKTGVGGIVSCATPFLHVMYLTSSIVISNLWKRHRSRSQMHDFPQLWPQLTQKLGGNLRPWGWKLKHSNFK